MIFRTTRVEIFHTDERSDRQTDMWKLKASKSIITKKYYHKLITYRRQIFVDCEIVIKLFSD